MIAFLKSQTIGPAISCHTRVLLGRDFGRSGSVYRAMSRSAWTAAVDRRFQEHARPTGAATERTAWWPSPKTTVACAYPILLQGKKREITSLPAWSAPTESPGRAADSSPGSASLRAQPWVKIYKSSAADSEAARSAKFICGSPIRPISRIRPIPPHLKSTFAHPKSTVDLGCERLIWVENGLGSPLSPTSYRPISAPKIKESNQTQTVTGRKNFIMGTVTQSPVAPGRGVLRKKNCLFFMRLHPNAQPVRLRLLGSSPDGSIETSLVLGCCPESFRGWSFRPLAQYPIHFFRTG
jgi:hypothetical protein